MGAVRGILDCSGARIPRSLHGAEVVGLHPHRVDCVEMRLSVAAMTLTRQEIEKVALLARLILTPEELDEMTGQLGRVLEYMALLNEVDTDGVEPLAHAVEFANVFREDRVEKSLDRELALANAPHRDDECYLVPAVLGDV